VKALLVCLLLLPLAALAQAPVIQISGANFRPLPLAVPAPMNVDEGAGRLAADFDAPFVFDLRASGIFQVLDRASFTADAKEGMTAGSINFSRWSDVGAESLVKVQLGAQGGTLRGELRLFNVGTGREDLKVSRDVPSTEPRQLAHFLADALYRHLTHEPSPFLSRITYVRKTGSNRDVWVADWDGNSARALTSGGINLLPAMGPGGAVGFTSYRRGRPDLYVQKPGEEAKAVVQNGQMATGIAWSPDGKRIAYALAEGESTQLYVANPDGSSPKALTDTPYGINSSPAWSPDGKRIAFVSNRGGSPQIYVMGADGSSPKRLTFQGNYNQTPDWSPRGDLIAFTARDERNAFDLFTVNVDTGKINRLTQDQGNNEEPVFSPNGRHILFTSTRDGTPRLHVMTSEGNNPIALPMDKVGGLTPDWAPAPAAAP
jgi:TolB protein